MESERKRAFRYPSMPSPGFGSTSHTVLSASWSCPKRPEAPRRSVTTPMTVPTVPLPGSRALRIISSMMRALCSPRRPRSCATICPSAASAPKTMPAIAITTMSSGAIENAV